MKTGYFTFGQDHEHVKNGQVFDKDTVVKITAFDPREVMFMEFGTKWSMHYDEPPDMRFFPGGVIEWPNEPEQVI
jgi:hypothetical protein